MKDSRLSQTSGDLGCIYKKELIIGIHMDKLLAIGTTKELDNTEKKIQQQE